MSVIFGPSLKARDDAKPIHVLYMWGIRTLVYLGVFEHERWPSLDRSTDIGIPGNGWGSPGLQLGLVHCAVTAQATSIRHYHLKSSVLRLSTCTAGERSFHVPSERGGRDRNPP